MQDQEAVNRHPAPTPRQLVEVALAHPPAFRPGQGWQYSQTNYALSACSSSG
ncbi:hypothetical protein ACTWPT_21820 [Nonomuraea sp. 3N208]|uniref:hypothetical protein n=1 Tax=Nonomuraea sp. 3N208 TaxID=3457421 RepID=UPI003FCCE69C